MVELDHLFVATAHGGGPARAALDAAGLAVSYERRHVGQGTANACYALDDCFIELLWVVDEAELRSPAVAPTALADRLLDPPACPFGIALRGDLPVPAFDWAPTFLPPGMTLPVAVGSADPALPMVFTSPGTAPPLRWTDGRAGTRQVAAGLTASTGLRLTAPAGVAADPLLQALAAAGLAEIAVATTWTAELSVARADGTTVVIRLWRDDAEVLLPTW